MANSERKGRLRGILTAAGLALGGGLFGFFLGRMAFRGADRVRLTTLDLVGGIALLLLFMLLVFAIHEAGHLAAGKLAGFRFMMFIAGPVRIQRDGGKIRVGLHWNLRLFGGVAASIPLDTTNLRRRMLLFTAGGPAASVLSALLAGIAWLALDGKAQTVVAMFGFLSLAVAAAVAIPMRTSGFHTDGARCLMLLRGGREAERWCTLAAVAGTSQNGVRPRDWDPELVARAEAGADDSFDGTGLALCLAQRAMDLGRIEQAGEWMDRVVAQMGSWPDAFRPGLMVEAAYFEARHRGNAAAGRSWLDKAVPRALLERSTLLRAEAAVLLAEGRTEEARRCLDQALPLAAASHDRGFAVAESEWLNQMRGDAAERLPQVS